MASSSTAGAQTHPERAVRAISAIPGHLNRRLLDGEILPQFPSMGHRSNFNWLTRLFGVMTLGMRTVMHQWNLGNVVVFAHHLAKVCWNWDGLGALVEQWHPDTHTFFFHDFEATILLEEVEKFFRWSGLSYDPLTELPPWNTYVKSVVEDQRVINQMTNGQGIVLEKFGDWLVDHVRDLTDEQAMRGMLICLAGLLLFPTNGVVLLFEYTPVLSLLERRQSLGPALLAFLYDSLNTMSLGGPSRGSLYTLQLWLEMHVKFDYGESTERASRIFKRSAIYPCREWYNPANEVRCLTGHLKKRADWRSYLSMMTTENFIATPQFMKSTIFRVRNSPKYELWLIGVEKAVLYQPHRCHPQLCIPRAIPLPAMTASRVLSRRLGTPADRGFADRNWRSWTLHTRQQEFHMCVQEDAEEVERYEPYFGRLRPVSTTFFMSKPLPK